MIKRYLTLDDLQDYYSTHKRSFHFKAEDKEPIVVQLKAELKFDENEITEGLTPVEIKSFHDGSNANSSCIPTDVLENKFIPTFKNRPILGYIHSVEKDGKVEKHFWEHNMTLVDDEIEYEEAVVGVVPETNNIRLEYDEEYDRNFVIVDGYIFDEYTHAKEIIEREQVLNVSVELSIKSFYYDANKKLLMVEDGYVSGITILGVDDYGNEVKPGMKGSNLKLKDFKKLNNSMFTQIDKDKLVEALDMMNKAISNFNIQAENSVEKITKGGAEVSKFEELLEQYGKTVEEIPFEWENLSDEELETAFAGAFAEDSDEETLETAEELTEEVPQDEQEESEVVDVAKVETEETKTNEVDSEVDEVDNEADAEVSEVVDEVDNEATDTEEDKPVDEAESENVEEEEKEKELNATYSMSVGKVCKKFSLSLNEKIWALITLVNETYADDDDWYEVEVYDDYLIAKGWNKSFRQAYEEEDGKFSLVGEKVEVHPVYLTSEEEAELDKIKADAETLEEVTEELEQYKSEPEKVEILNSDEYKQIFNTDEYKELSKRENYFNLSVDEIKEKADSILLNYAKKGKITFSTLSNNKDTFMNEVGLFNVKTSSNFLDELLNK